MPVTTSLDLLMIKVMKNAVKDYLSKRKGKESKKRHKEAEAWLFDEDNDPDSPFNLENICVHLGYNPAILRVNIRLAREAGMSLAQYMTAWESGKLDIILKKQIAAEPAPKPKKKRKAMK